MNELAKLPTALSFYGGLTAAEARDKLAKHGRQDSESAHGVEDEFVRQVLAAISQGHPEPARLAADALTVLDADYQRWFA